MTKHRSPKSDFLKQRMEQLFGSFNVCWRETRIGHYMSHETARQILLFGKEPTLHHLLVVMSALQFPQREIIEQLKDRNDTYVWPLLSPDDQSDTSLHRIARSIRRMGPKTRRAVTLSIKRILREENIDINAQNWEGLTPLMVAAKSGNDAMAMLLLELGAKYDMADIGGRTVLEHGKQGNCAGLLATLREVAPDFVLDRFLAPEPDNSKTK